MSQIRRFSLPILSAFFLVVFFIAAAHAEVDARGKEIPKWYAGLGGSLVFLDSYSTHFKDDARIFTSSSFKFKPGFGLSAMGGYRFNPYVSAELQILYTSTDSDSQTGVDVSKLPKGSNQRPQSNIGLMANGYLHYPNSTLFTPYVGGGLGMVYVETPLYAPIKNLAGDVIESKDLQDWVFGYQLMLGVNYELPPSMMDVKSEISLGYRYLHADDGEVRFKTVPGYGILFDNSSQNVDVNWRFYF